MSTRLLLSLPPIALAAAAAVPVLAQSNAGEQLFRQRCASCHTVAPGGAPGPIGPNLRGVVGRAAGGSSFKAYSPALKSARLTWTKANLDKFLTAPGKLVPGTRMVIAVTDPKQRAAVVAYLASQR